jgi:hypothetical protein
LQYQYAYCVKNAQHAYCNEKIKTTRPNEQTWSNAFHGILGVRTVKKTMPNTPGVAPPPPLQPLLYCIAEKIMPVYVSVK